MDLGAGENTRPMKYLCLGYLDVAAFDQISAEEQSAVMTKCFAQCKPFRATGTVVEEEGLQGVSTARSLRTRGGKLRVTDGPFVETKEQLGSFFIIEADSMEEAIQVASLHPAAMFGEEYGFGIEVRPISE